MKDRAKVEIEKAAKKKHHYISTDTDQQNSFTYNVTKKNHTNTSNKN